MTCKTALMASCSGSIHTHAQSQTVSWPDTGGRDKQITEYGDHVQMWIHSACTLPAMHDCIGCSYCTHTHTHWLYTYLSLTSLLSECFKISSRILRGGDFPYLAALSQRSSLVISASRGQGGAGQGGCTATPSHMHTYCKGIRSSAGMQYSGQVGAYWLLAHICTLYTHIHKWLCTLIQTLMPTCMGTHRYTQANVNADTECLRSFQLSMHTYTLNYWKGHTVHPQAPHSHVCDWWLSSHM